MPNLSVTGASLREASSRYWADSGREFGECIPATRNSAVDTAVHRRGGALQHAGHGHAW